MTRYHREGARSATARVHIKAFTSLLSVVYEPYCCGLCIMIDQAFFVFD